MKVYSEEMQSKRDKKNLNKSQILHHATGKVKDDTFSVSVQQH